MRLRSFLTRLVRDQRGEIAEFALVLPVALLFLIGLTDAGRLFYEINKGEKATQIGARWAVVTDPITPELASENYVGQIVGGSTLTQGDRIPAAALGLITCNETSCTCTTNPCPNTGTLTRDATAFDNLLGRMQDIMPNIQASNLIVEYRGSGLGYAGNPNGIQIAPLVTISLADLSFSPAILLGFAINLPDFSYTLTMEDGAGSFSN